MEESEVALPEECFVNGERDDVLSKCLVDVLEEEVVIGVERPEDVVGLVGTLS